MSLSALITDFLDYLKHKRFSPLTVRNYKYYLKSFLQFAGDISPSQIDLAQVNNYKQYLCGQAVKKNTQNYFLIALRSFLKYLGKINIATLDASKVGLLSWEPPRKQVLDREKLRCYLRIPDSTIAGLRDRAVLETLYYCGLKISQLVNLNRGASCGSKELDRYLKARKDTFEPLFIRFQGRVDPRQSGKAMRLSSRSIQRIVEKYAKKTDF